MVESFVGLENLPNVYFRDITISSINAVQGQQKFSTIEIKLVVKDKQKNGSFQWADNELLGTYLNVSLIQSLDKDFTQQLTSGQYTLNTFDFKASPNYDESVVSDKVKRLRPNGDLNMYSIGNDVYEFEYIFSFDIKDEDLIDVAYFAALTIDHAALAADYMADLDNSEIKFFQGPISSEKVFVDGVLQTKTNVFYLPDNRIWSGAVHLHEGNYMPGAFHKPEPHPNLRLAEIQNLKLKDNRLTENASKKLNTFDGKRLFIGKPYATKDETNAIKQILYFDMENMFIEKTKYGELLKNLNASLFDQALESFKIKKFVIKRKFVSKAKGASSFKTKKKSHRILNDRTEIALIASDFTQFGFAPIIEQDRNAPLAEIKKRTVPYNKLMEIDMNHKKYRYFNFADFGFRNIKYGNYIYGIELTLIDRTKQFMSDLYKTYKNDIKDLEDYSLRSTKAKNVNKTSGKFNEAFLMGENMLFNLDNPENLNLAPWIRGVENYINLKSYLYDLSEEQKATQAQNLYSSINPKTGTRSGITTFTEMYRNLLNELLYKFDLEKMKLGTFENRRSPANNSQTHPNLVFIAYDYDDIFDATDPIEGYRIIEKIETDEATQSITRDLFEDRRKQEVKRFFKGAPNFTQDESKNLDQDDLESLTDITTFSTAYMSPVKLIASAKNIDLTETNLVDNSLLNDTVEKIKRKRRRGRGFFRKRIRLQKLKNKASTNDNNPRFENTSEYLGDNSPLLNIDFGYTLEDLKDIEKIKVEKKMKDAVAKKRKKKLIKDYDLTKENNVIFKEKRNKSPKGLKASKKEKSARARRKSKFRKIPLHTKAIMFSRSANVRTNLLNSANDLLASDETENKLLIEHFGVHKIEYFAGFEMDKASRPIFNKPKWELLDYDTYKNTTTQNLICRAVSLDDELIGMRLPEELELEVFDKYFVIEASEQLPQSTIVSQNNLAVNLESTSNVNYDYSTTNPVVQPLKENSIFTEQPQPNMQRADLQTSSRSGELSSRQRRGRQRRNRVTPSIRGTY